MRKCVDDQVSPETDQGADYTYDGMEDWIGRMAVMRF